MKKRKFLVAVLAILAMLACLCACALRPNDGSDKNPTDPDTSTDPTDPTDPSDPAGPSDPTNPTDPSDPTGPSGTIDLSDIFAKYSDPATQNFAVTLDDGESTDYYEYLGYDILNRYEATDGNFYIDYLTYDPAEDVYTFYADLGEGEYEIYPEGTDDFDAAFSYLYIIDLSAIGDYDFTESGNKYVADDPDAAGNAVLGEYVDEDGNAIAWTSFELSIANGDIAKIVGVMEDGVTFAYTFSKQGAVSFTLPSGGTTPVDPDDPTDPDTDGYVLELTRDSLFPDLNDTVYEHHNGSHAVGGFTVTTTNVLGNTHHDYDVLQFKKETGTMSVSGEFTQIVVVIESTYDYNNLNKLTVSVGSAALAVSEHATEHTGVKDGNYEILIHTLVYDVNATGVQQITVTNTNSNAVYALSIGFVGEGGSAPVEPDEPADSSVFEAYADRSTWNFSVFVTDNEDALEDYYEYDGNRILNYYVGYDADYTDYLTYDEASDLFTYYSDNGDGTYTVYDEASSEFEEYYTYCCIVDLTYLADFSYTLSGNVYSALSPDEVGVAVLGDYGIAWTSFTVTVTDGKIMMIVARMSDGYEMQYEFSDHGTIHITLPDAEGGGSDVDPTPSGTMEKQTYNSSTFDNERLQDKLLKEDGAIGLPSTGDYHALVIPVQFVGDTISKTQLDNLNIAFNGTEEQTGWESVKTYYQKASYGNLNLTFDIQEVYKAAHNASYYAGIGDGDLTILNEALAYYESKLDLTKYDTNDDGAIDAVYLIYSASVDYDSADFYWAYVYWDTATKTYDGKDVYYYLFAGFDFMDEKTSNDKGSGYDIVLGMKINAETYIHESGHLLGLDDYYDYYTEDTYDAEYGGTIKAGSNEGLGGADMMDYNIGDHDVYTKIMLGWLTPTVVTENKTVTIDCSGSSASAILIPLNFDNSYFCEYLLIDLYAATGLNRAHASDLYDGAAFGVRIYHVSSSIDNPYQNDGYSSFTDNNNSVSEHALIKLVEADGEKRFASSDGYAAETDLWQAGDTLSEAFPSYTRNDGKTLNFDIIIENVSATSATVQIVFY